MAELLIEIWHEAGRGDIQEPPVETGGFGEIAAEERAVQEALEKCLGDGGGIDQNWRRWSRKGAKSPRLNSPLRMTNNDTLRRLRFALDINDSKVAKIVTHTGRETARAEVDNWLKREDEAGFTDLSDADLCRFLDGLIIEKRGPRPDGSIPEPLEFLSNNEILKKLRIALELRDDDINAIFDAAEFVVTKAELGSFFRKEGHRNYRKCPEQVLRKFISGVTKKPEKTDI